jgi:hypothetical protein
MVGTALSLRLGNANAVPDGFVTKARRRTLWLKINSCRDQSLSIIAWIPGADLVNIAHFEKRIGIQASLIDARLPQKRATRDYEQI